LSRGLAPPRGRRERFTASPETSRDLLRPLAKPRQKLCIPNKCRRIKERLGGIRLIPRKRALKCLLPFLTLFMGAENWLQTGAGSPNPMNRSSCQTNEYCVRIGPRAQPPPRVGWSRQVTHLGKSLRGNARDPTNRVPCQMNEYYVWIGPRAQSPPQAAGDGAGRSPTLENR
jgi:hypothetical protein